MKPSRRQLAAAGGAAVLLPAVITGLLFAGSSSAVATTAPPQPLRIANASLVQDGQALVWQVQLAQPFSPRGLSRARRALCLLIERSRAGTVVGEVCVTGPARRSRAPRLVYKALTGTRSGPSVPVAATVTRSSASELSASFLPSAVGLAYKPMYWQVISSLRAAACAPPAPGGGSCFELYPGKPSRLDLHTPILTGCVASGPSLVYHAPGAGGPTVVNHGEIAASGHGDLAADHGSAPSPEIALTFDDGPWNEPPTIDFLSVLEREHVPATFFEIGRQIAPYDPGGVAEKRMLADGDMIGDHSWSHPDVAALSPAGQRAQLLEAAAAIRRATGGFTPCLWRPPNGDISPSLIKLARSLGFLTVMWNVDPRDWALPGVDAIYSNVVANASPGAIVIQHFGGGPRYETLEALPREIATLRRRGYQFVTVAQLLGLRLLYR